MPVVLQSGIVARYVNYRENDRILTIITPGKGRIDAKARGARRTTSPLLSCAQPFVFGEFELFFNKDKYTVNACQVTESFFPVREDIERFALGSSMLQLAADTVQENENSEPLFLLLYHALTYLSYGQSDPTDLFLCFLVRFMKISGFTPAIVSCGQCGRDIRGDSALYFGARSGGAVCASCARGEKGVSKTALEAMRRMLLLSDGEMDRVRMSAPIRRELLNALIAYVEDTLEYGPRALAFVRQMQPARA